MITYDASAYFGFYNASQWKPTAIGFYNGKVAGNRFNLVFPKYKKEFNSVSECYRWIKNNKYLTYTKTERSLSREIKNKGEVKFVEGEAKVEWICGKLERNTSYETISKRRILTDEEVQNKKEWEEFERKTIEELENKKASSLDNVVQDKKETQNVSDVIIKSKSIKYNIYNNNIYNNNIIFNNNIGSEHNNIIFNNNIGSELPSVLLDKYETWESFSKSNEIWHLLKRRPTIKDFIDYKHNKLTIREAS